MPERRLEGDLGREEEWVVAECGRLQDAVFGTRVFNGIVRRPILEAVMEIPLNAGGDVLSVERDGADEYEEQGEVFIHGNACWGGLMKRIINTIAWKNVNSMEIAVCFVDKRAGGIIV